MPNRRNQIQQRIALELAHLAQLGPMLKGTVCEVRRGPRKTGTGERTAHILTYKGKGNKTRTVYIPAQRLPEVQDMVARHREAIHTLGRVADLSVDLFKAKREPVAQAQKKR